MTSEAVVDFHNDSPTGMGGIIAILREKDKNYVMLTEVLQNVALDIPLHKAFILGAALIAASGKLNDTNLQPLIDTIVARAIPT